MIRPIDKRFIELMAEIGAKHPRWNKSKVMAVAELNYVNKLEDLCQ